MSQTFRFVHIIRLMVIFSIGYIVWMYAPVIKLPPPEIMGPKTMGVIFVFLAGFLIHKTIERNKLLDLSISMELSRMRRITHLIESMSISVSIKSSIRNQVILYLHTVSENDFVKYELSHPEFHDLTHAVYLLNLKTDHDKIVFQEMLSVTREAAFHRQQISSHLTSSISPYTWVSMFVIVILSLISFIISKEPGIVSNVLVCASVMSVLLVFDILIELDMLTKPEREKYRKLYAENSIRIKNEK